MSTSLVGDECLCGLSSRRLARVWMVFFARTRRRDARGFSLRGGFLRFFFLCCVFTVCCTDINLSRSKERIIEVDGRRERFVVGTLGVLRHLWPEDATKQNKEVVA